MIQEDKNRCLAQSFDSWSDFIRHVSESPCEMPLDSRSSQRIDEEAKTSSKGTRNFEEALELARKGWPEGANRAVELVAGIENKLYSLIESPVLRYDVFGELLDVGRYCSGEPEHWGVWDTELREGKGTKHVSVVVNLAASGGLSPAILTARGSCIAALVNLLELAGRHVRVDIVAGVSGTKGYMEYRVPCKPYDEHVDIELLTFMLAHPATLRRLLFAAMERIPEWYRKDADITHMGGYGTPAEIKTDRGDIYLPEATYGDKRWATPESATKWVSEELHKLGVIREL